MRMMGYFVMVFVLDAVYECGKAPLIVSGYKIQIIWPTISQINLLGLSYKFEDFNCGIIIKYQIEGLLHFWVFSSGLNLVSKLKKLIQLFNSQLSIFNYSLIRKSLSVIDDKRIICFVVAQCFPIVVHTAGGDG